MKCPHCKKEVPVHSGLPGWFMNAFLVSLIYFPMSQLAIDEYNLPWNLAHGASMNYDMFPILGFIAFFWGYNYLYKKGKLKGRFLFFKDD